MKKMTANQILAILNEEFPFYDNSGTSWEHADEEKGVLRGSARHHYYKTNINGKDYYILRNGMDRGKGQFYLSRQDIIDEWKSANIYNSYKEKSCSKEDIIKDALK